MVIFKCSQRSLTFRKTQYHRRQKVQRGGGGGGVRLFSEHDFIQMQSRLFVVEQGDAQSTWFSNTSSCFLCCATSVSKRFSSFRSFDCRSIDNNRATTRNDEDLGTISTPNTHALLLSSACSILPPVEISRKPIDVHAPICQVAEPSLPTQIPSAEVQNAEPQLDGRLADGAGSVVAFQPQDDSLAPTSVSPAPSANALEH